MSALTDPISDFLTRLRNGCQAGKPEIMAPYSKIKFEIARILKQEGYISNFELDTNAGVHPQLKVVNKFINRTPAITGLKRVSKPGLQRAQQPRRRFVLGSRGDDAQFRNRQTLGSGA